MRSTCGAAGEGRSDPRGGPGPDRRRRRRRDGVGPLRGGRMPLPPQRPVPPVRHQSSRPPETEDGSCAHRYRTSLRRHRETETTPRMRAGPCTGPARMPFPGAGRPAEAACGEPPAVDRPETTNPGCSEAPGIRSPVSCRASPPGTDCRMGQYQCARPPMARPVAPRIARITPITRSITPSVVRMEIPVKNPTTNRIRPRMIIVATSDVMSETWKSRSPAIE